MQFQHDTGSLIQWSELWQLKLNPDKRTVLHIGMTTLHHTYRMVSSADEYKPY